MKEKGAENFLMIKSMGLKSIRVKIKLKSSSEIIINHSWFLLYFCSVPKTALMIAIPSFVLELEKAMCSLGVFDLLKWKSNRKASIDNVKQLCYLLLKVFTFQEILFSFISWSAVRALSVWMAAFVIFLSKAFIQKLFH